MVLRHRVLGLVRSPRVLLVLLVLLVAGLALGPTRPASAATPATVSLASSVGNPLKVVDAVNWGTKNGTPTQMWQHRVTGNVLNQRWNPNWVGYNSWADFYTFINVNAGRCLDESAPRNGAVVYLYQCTGKYNQQWYWASVDGHQAMINRQDNRCLDIKDYNPYNGARLQVWACTGTWNQRFEAIAD
jgi:hypothetical protein